MPCYHPLIAWRTTEGEITIGHKEPENADSRLQLPCGGCLGCNQKRAQAWALRCTLELQQHNTAVFVTLTYDENHLPITLQKRHLQLWIKRLRKHPKTKRFRFFASGEYGETYGRPHYHAILFGLQYIEHAQIIQDTWALGNARTENITPARIAYAAGYAAKKIGWRRNAQEERVDANTGEIYNWQPPFIQMSRRPGIGADARKHKDAWRSYAVLNGIRIPVPRYLHEAWKQTATQQEIEELQYEKYKYISAKGQPTKQQLQAAYKIAIAKQQLKAKRRAYA